MIPANGIRIWAFALITLIGAWLCWLMVEPFLSALTWALALAVVMHPVHSWLHRRTGNESLAAALTLVITVAVLLGPGAFLVQQAVQEAVEFGQWFRAENESGGLRERLDSVPWLKAAFDRFVPQVDFVEELQKASGRITGWVSSFLARSFWGITQFVITLFSLFFLLRDADGIRATAITYLPLEPAESETVLRRVAETIHATLYGRFAASCAQGFLGGLMFWILGVPGPALWGTAMAATSLLPSLGPALIWLPAAAYLLLQGSWIKAAIMAAWGGLVVGFVDNLIYPYAVGERLQMHTLVIFFAAFGGITVFGMAGLVLGPAVVAATVALADVWRRRGLQEEAPLIETSRPE